jgi:hypothetical protein
VSAIIEESTRTVGLLILREQVSPRKTKLPHRHFVARELAGRSFAQGKIRLVKQIAFAIYLTKAILMGISLPIPSNPHP